MGRGANGHKTEIYPGRPDLDRRHQGLVSVRAKAFVRHNPGLKSFTATDLVADRDQLTEEEIAERAASITKGLLRLEELGKVVRIDVDSEEGEAYALTELGASGMGGDEVAAILR